MGYNFDAKLQRAVLPKLERRALKCAASIEQGEGRRPHELESAAPCFFGVCSSETAGARRQFVRAP